MRGLPDENYPAFFHEAKLLRARGFEVYNPAVEPKGQTLEYYMAIDLPEVCKADAVAVLPDWETSQGARIEVDLARRLCKPVWDARTLVPIPQVNSVETNGSGPVNGSLVRSESGTVRSSIEGKVDYTLALDGPLFKLWAAHMTAHASEKGRRNWMNASTEEDLERFRQSFLRHAVQFLSGDTEEDHAAAIAFNLNGILYVNERL